MAIGVSACQSFVLWTFSCGCFSMKLLYYPLAEHECMSAGLAAGSGLSPVSAFSAELWYLPAHLKDTGQVS